MTGDKALDRLLAEVAEDEAIATANADWPNFDPDDPDTGIYSVLRKSDDHETAGETNE